MRNQPDQVEADAHLDRCIQSLFKVAEGIDLARESGDFDFGMSPLPSPIDGLLPAIIHIT